MDAQEQNLCLLNMPDLVLDKILSNIHNPSNVSRSCKYLYEIVCDMEKHRRVLHIGASDAKSPLNIDADAVFDSMMNSHRTIKEIELRVIRLGSRTYELKEQQLQRITAIMKRFGANATSLKFRGFKLPDNFILQMLQRAPNLESLSFTDGKVIGSITENATMSLQLPSLKALDIENFIGFLGIVNLIPAGSLSSIRHQNRLTESSEVLATVLTRQHNIKSLTLDVHFNFNLNDICVDHLQLETLTLKVNSCRFDDNSLSQFVEILNCQTNLKELRFINYDYDLSGSSFRWICNNLKKLEVFEVDGVDSMERNAFEMLGELKQLRHYRTYVAHNLFRDGFQSFKSDAIEKLDFGFWPLLRCVERFTKMVDSMAHNLPNLTHLKMSFENFSALSQVLGHCTKIIHLTCNIRHPNPDQLTQQRFMNIQSLELRNDFYGSTSDEMISQSMTSIVRTMPNLKSMSLLIRSGLKFDVNELNEFIKESKSLDYLYVNWFELRRKLSKYAVVGIIRCLIDQLKGFHINFRPPTSGADVNFDKIKEILRDECYIRDDYSNDYRNLPTFSLYKGRKTFPYF